MSGLFLVLIGCAALLGLAVAALIWQLLPATPALAPALNRLRPGHTTAYVHPTRRRMQNLVNTLVPDADLAILRITRAQYVTKLGTAALVGLGLVPLLAGTAALMGMGLTLALPAITGLGFAFVAVVYTYRDVRYKAKMLRADYRRGVCIYLDQVASVLASGRGPVESMERAARIGSGGVFDAIRSVLTSARAQMQSPWDQLRELGRQLEVPSLGDLGEIMTTSAGGAKVYQALRETTTALRSEIRYDDLGAAKTGSTGLESLGAAVVLILIVIMAYPFVGPMLGS